MRKVSRSALGCRTRMHEASTDTYSHLCVDDNRIGLGQSQDERSGGGAPRRRPPIGCVDVKPQPLRSAELRQRHKRIHGARVDGAGIAHHADRVIPVRPVCRDLLRKRLEIDREVIQNRDLSQLAAAHAEQRHAFVNRRGSLLRHVHVQRRASPTA